MASVVSRPNRPQGNVRGEATRSRLLEAAIEAFSNRGFRATSTRDLAEAAGMSAAVVYAHYRTKEELLFTLSLTGHSEVLDVVSRAAPVTDPSPVRLRATVREFAAWHARFHTRARVIQYELACLTSEHYDQIAELRRRTQAQFRHIVDAGLKDGAFDVDEPSLTTLAIVSLGIDVSRWYQATAAWSPEYIGEQYSDLALRMVGHR